MALAVGKIKDVAKILMFKYLNCVESHSVINHIPNFTVKNLIVRFLLIHQTTKGIRWLQFRITDEIQWVDNGIYRDETLKSTSAGISFMGFFNVLVQLLFGVP